MRHGIQLSETEQALVRGALNNSAGLRYSDETLRYELSLDGGDAVPVYQTLYSILEARLSDASLGFEDVQGIKNAKLWLSVAIEANGGVGVFSDIIRSYTTREGELRLGRTFSDLDMQAASNVVARNLVNGLINGSPKDSLSAWTVPTITQIASLDAAAVGEQLFEVPLGVSGFCHKSELSMVGNHWFFIARWCKPI